MKYKRGIRMLYEIRLAEEDDIRIIVELLNKVTLNLHQKSINQWTYPWDIEEINIDVKNKNIYMMTIDKLIVLHINKPNNLYLYRIAILPGYQGKDIGLKIVNYAFKISRNLRKTLYLDCWAGNVKLKNYYSKAGFDYCGDFQEKDYMISVFKYTFPLNNLQ